MLAGGGMLFRNGKVYPISYQNLVKWFCLLFKNEIQLILFGLAHVCDIKGKP
jgi:hypothetical protein